MTGNGSGAATGAQQKRLLVIKNKVLRADSLTANKQTISTPNNGQFTSLIPPNSNSGTTGAAAVQQSKVIRMVNQAGPSQQNIAAINALKDKIESTKRQFNDKFNTKKAQQASLLENVNRELQELKKEQGLDRKLRKSDAVYPDYQRALEIAEELKAVRVEKK